MRRDGSLNRVGGKDSSSQIRNVVKVKMPYECVPQERNNFLFIENTRRHNTLLEIPIFVANAIYPSFASLMLKKK